MLSPYNLLDMELILLAWFFNVRKYWRDRQTSGFVEDMNTLTGLPSSTKNLGSVSSALAGEELARTVTPPATDLAASMIRYHADDSTVCVHREECDGCRELGLKPRDKWTAEERDAHEVITHMVKVSAMRMAGKGWIDPHPLLLDNEPHPLDPDGLPTRFGITSAGMEEAKRRVRGTRYESWFRGWEQAVMRSELSQLPDYVRSRSA